MTMKNAAGYARYRALALVLPVLIAATCSGKRSDADVRAWFAKGQVGGAPDVGLFQQSSLRGEWDHVLTIHSMADDLETCHEIIAALQVKRFDAVYDCRLLN